MFFFFSNGKFECLPICPSPPCGLLLSPVLFQSVDCVNICLGQTIGCVSPRGKYISSGQIQAFIHWVLDSWVWESSEPNFDQLFVLHKKSGDSQGEKQKIGRVDGWKGPGMRREQGAGYTPKNPNGQVGWRPLGMGTG